MPRMVSVNHLRVPLRVGFADSLVQVAAWGLFLRPSQPVSKQSRAQGQQLIVLRVFDNLLFRLVRQCVQGRPERGPSGSRIKPRVLERQDRTWAVVPRRGLVGATTRHSRAARAEPGSPGE